jgi:hypothetical protein
MVSEKGEFLLFFVFLLRSLGRAIYTSKGKVSKEKTAYKGITPNHSISRTPQSVTIPSSSQLLFRQTPNVQCTVPPLVRVFRSTYSVTRAMKSWARNAPADFCTRTLLRLSRGFGEFDGVRIHTTAFECRGLHEGQKSQGKFAQQFLELKGR